MRLVEALDAQNEKVVALVGGGGKTTIMSRLAAELAGLGSRVVITTTTRIYPPTSPQVDVNVLCEDCAQLMSQVRESLASCRVVGVGLGLDQDGKQRGIPADWVAELAKLADNVIVEADGAAGKPLKAPADYEPVIPPSTTLVVAVVGIDAIGLPLHDANVHRPARIAAITRLRLGDPITVEAVADVIQHPQGIAKGAPGGARIVPFLNKVDRHERLAQARQIAHLLVERAVAGVVIGNVQSEDPVLETIMKERVLD